MQVIKSLDFKLMDARYANKLYLHFFYMDSKQIIFTFF